jgi:hypothetical protein
VVKGFEFARREREKVRGEYIGLSSRAEGRMKVRVGFFGIS